MTPLKKIALLSVLLLPAVACFSQTTAKTALDEDAEFVSITHEYRLNKDGNTAYSCEQRLRYLSFYSFNRAYGETFIVYNPSWQTLTINSCETRMADGTIVKAPPNAFNEVLPRFAANAAPYLHLREMVVTHTGLERNATAHLAYRIDTKKGFMPGLSGKVLCGGRSPIRSMTIRVVLPAGVDLKYEFLRSAALPVQTQEGGNTVYTWSLSEIPMIRVESNQPGYETLAPLLHFSTYDLKALRSHVLSDKRAMALPASARKTVAAVTSEERDVLAKALALRKWVETNCAAADGDLSHFGYKPMTAQQTYAQAVGSSLDRAVLLAALCLEAGMDAAPVLTAADKTVSSLDAYTGAAVLLRGAGNEPMLLDPNSQQFSPVSARLHGRHYLPLTGDGEPVLYKRSVKNLVSLTSDWIMKEDGTVSGRSRAVQDGVFGVPFDVKRASSQLKRVLAQAGQGMTVSDEQSEAITGIGSAAEAAVSSRPLEERGGLMVFKIPRVPFGIEEMQLNPGPVGRITPLALPADMSQELKMTLHLLQSVRLAVAPAPIEIRNSIGSVKSVVKFDGDVEITRMLTIAVSKAPPEKYRELRELLAAWDDPAHAMLLLENRKK